MTRDGILRHENKVPLCNMEHFPSWLESSSPERSKQFACFHPNRSGFSFLALIYAVASLRRRIDAFTLTM